MKKKIKVYFDGNCKICSKEISFYSKLDHKKKFNWINIHNDSKEIKKTGISKKKLISILHIKKKDGSFVKGVEAFRVIWSEFKYFKILAYFLRFKLIMNTVNVFYKTWLKNR